jgi:hypothetical protein
MPELRTAAAVRLKRTLRLANGALAAAALVLVAAGCVAAPSTAAPSQAPGALTNPVPSPSPAVSAAATPIAAAALNSSGAAPTPSLPPATIEVSPAQVQAGGVTLSLSVEPARHMLPQTAITASDPDPAHQLDGSAKTAPSTAVVLDGMLRLTNNLDPSQPLPDDQPQSMIRHVNVEVSAEDRAYPVPYLSVSMDMLLDGRPMIQGVSAVPMIAAESTAPRLYYGNNVKLVQRGTYQVFVRLQPSTLLGKDPPPAAQFNVAVR